MPRSPLADTILRPHEQSTTAHPNLATKAAVEALDVRVSAVEAVSGAAPATITSLGLVRMASHGETAGGAVAVQADDPRLTQSLSGSPPADLGVASPGSSTQGSRADHVHQMPTPDQLLGVWSPTGGAALDVDNGTLCWDIDKNPIEQMAGLIP